MEQYKVKLELTFEPHGCDVQEEYDDEGELMKMNNDDQEKYDFFQRTDEFFEKNDIVKYIKNICDAYSFVENLVSDGEVISAKWVPKEFAVEMIVDTEQDAEELEEDLRNNSLEDSEYEACCETGWIIMTRDKDGEAFGLWEYGLTDYRQNKITIEKICEKLEIPNAKELFQVTEKGKEIHKKMGEEKWKGVKFSEEDEAKFKILCKILQDKRMYPV